MGYNPARESLEIDQFQVLRSGNVIEDCQPLAQNYRVSNQMVLVYKSRCYQAPHKSGTSNCADRFPGSDLSSLIPSARSPSKTRASAQEAAARDSSAVVVCTVPMPLNGIYVFKTQIPVSLPGVTAATPQAHPDSPSVYIVSVPSPGC